MAGNSKSKTIQLPQVWRENFRCSVLRTGFGLQLSQAMLEFLCATADGVWWDRAHFPCLNRPDNWIATEAALTKRGLIERKSREELHANLDAARPNDGSYGPACCRLTPAGALVVQLVKHSGLYVEADDAIRKKHRKA